MTDRIPSLEAQLAAATNLSERIDALNELAWALRFSAPARTISFSEEARRLATTGPYREAPYARGLAISMAHLGGMEADGGNHTRALTLLLRALPMLEALEEGDVRQTVFGSLGRVCVAMGDHSHALQYVTKALSLARELGDRQAEAGHLNNLAWIHHQAGDHTMAMAHVKRSLPLYEELGSDSGCAYALETRASVYLGLGRADEAIHDARCSIELSRHTENHACEAEALNTLGRALLAEGDAGGAIAAHERALAVARERALRGRQVDSLIGIAAARGSLGGRDAARAGLSEALALAAEIDNKPLQSDCHCGLTRLFKAAGEFRAALDHFEHYHDLAVALANERSEARAQTLQIVHRVETTRREAEIHQLRNVTLQQEIDERRHAQAELERLATTDPLTHLANRRHFYELAQRALQEAQRYKRPLSLIMFDLDLFKQVNDTHGHAVGDRVLVGVAKLACGNVRQVDTMARYGGEEFAVLLPETSLDMAKRVAERLRQAIAEQSLLTPVGPVSVTISLGIAALTDDAETLDALLDRADTALYEAKSRGRNCVVA